MAIVGIDTRGAVLARRLHALVGELTEAETPIGDLDISFYRDDVGAKAPAAQPVVHASHIDFDLTGRTVVLVTTCCSPAAPCAPRWTRSSTTAGRSGFSSPCSATAATGELLDCLTTSAGPADCAAASGSTCGSRRPTRSTG